MAAYDEVWSYGFCFALVDLPQAEFDDGMIVARLLTNSPSQIHHLHQQHAPEKNLSHRIHRETMPHIVWWSVNEFLPICCSHLRRLEYLHRTVIRSTKMSKQARNGFRQWTRKRECSHKRRRDTTASKVIRDSRYCPLYSLHNNNNNNNSRLTALFRDYPGEPVPLKR